MRKQFTINTMQLFHLRQACRPVMYLVANGVEPSSPRKSAEDAWRHLGDELGFDWETVEDFDEDTLTLTAEAKP